MHKSSESGGNTEFNIIFCSKCNPLADSVCYSIRNNFADIIISGSPYQTGIKRFGFKIKILCNNSLRDVLNIELIYVPYFVYSLFLERRNKDF